MGLLDRISKLKDTAMVVAGSIDNIFEGADISEEAAKIRKAFDPNAGLGEDYESLCRIANRKGVYSGSLWKAADSLRKNYELSPLGDALIEFQIHLAYADAYFDFKDKEDDKSFGDLPADQQEMLQKNSEQYFEIALNCINEAIEHLENAEPDQIREYALDFYLRKYELVNSKYGLLWDYEERLDAVRTILNLLHCSEDSEVNARAHDFLQNYNCYAIALQPKEERLKFLEDAHEKDLKWIAEDTDMDDAEKAELLELINGNFPEFNLTVQQHHQV